MRDLVTTFLASAFVAIFVSAAAAQDAAAPPLVEQINGGNWLDPQEAEELRDELFYQRAIHAYMTMQPALNVIGMRDGSEVTFGGGYNVLPIWKDQMDSRTWVVDCDPRRLIARIAFGELAGAIATATAPDAVERR